MIWQIFFFSFTIWYFYLRWAKRKLYQMASQLKCDIKTLPFIGHAYIFIGDGIVRMNGLKLFSKQAIKYGLTNLWLGSQHFVVVADAEILEFIMKNCLEKDDTMRFVRDITGNGLAFAPVPIWRPRRKILAPTFSPKNLQGFVKIFSRQSSIMMDQLLKNAPIENFSIWSYFTSYTMDSICESTLGVRTKAQLDPDQPFLKAIEEGTKIIAARIAQPLFHIQSVFEASPAYRELMIYKKLVLNFIDQVIISNKEALKDKSAIKDASNKIIQEDDSKSFLELIMEPSGDAKGLSNIELQEEMIVLFVAGTDTSAVGASFTALMLSRHQDVQDKVYEELQEVIGDSDRPVVARDLARLKYLDAVIRETLRLHPPAPVIARKVEKDITLPSGLTLVEGTRVVVSIWGVHRNPQYWGADAEEFRPERFLDSTQMHSAFMAFSCGPRNCLGYQYAMMTMKTALAYLLRKYTVLPPAPDAEHQDFNHKPLRESFDLMMKDADKFTLRVKQRK